MTPQRFRGDKLAPSLFESSADGASWAVFSAHAPPGGEILPATNWRPTYRYLLGRAVLGVNGIRRVGFVMLNPSTATAHADDATVRKCVGFAKRWQATELLIANCYAFRAISPKSLQHAQDPIGPLNEQALRSLATRVDFIVCAWGRHARERGVATGRLLAEAGADLRCLGLNQDGSPKHPLYVAYESARGEHHDGPPKFTPVCGKGHAMLGSCGRCAGHEGSCTYVGGT